MVVVSALFLFGSLSMTTVSAGSENVNKHNNFGLIEPLQDDNETIIPPRPILAIEKSVNATLIEPGQWIHVEVNITNIGNGTAYNLTIIDPAFSNISFIGYNYTEQRFVQVDANASIYYHYYFQGIEQGNYTLEATEITYFDINGTEYKSYSDRFNILVLKQEEIPVLESDLWWQLFYYIIAVTVGLSLVVAVDYFIFVRPKQPKRVTRATLVGKTERKKPAKKKPKKKSKKKKKKK